MYNANRFKTLDVQTVKNHEKIEKTVKNPTVASGIDPIALIVFKGNQYNSDTVFRGKREKFDSPEPLIYQCHISKGKGLVNLSFSPTFKGSRTAEFKSKAGQYYLSRNTRQLIDWKVNSMDFDKLLTAEPFVYTVYGLSPEQYNKAIDLITTNNIAELKKDKALYSACFDKKTEKIVYPSACWVELTKNQNDDSVIRFIRRKKGDPTFDGLSVFTTFTDYFVECLNTAKQYNKSEDLYGDFAKLYTEVFNAEPEPEIKKERENRVFNL